MGLGNKVTANSMNHEINDDTTNNSITARWICYSDVKLLILQYKQLLV